MDRTLIIDKYLIRRGWKRSDHSKYKEYLLLFGGRTLRLRVTDNLSLYEYYDIVSAISVIEDRPENKIVDDLQVINEALIADRSETPESAISERGSP